MKSYIGRFSGFSGCHLESNGRSDLNLLKRDKVNKTEYIVFVMDLDWFSN